MRDRGWYTVKTHGNAYQSGIPDLLCWHKSFGFRMIEAKSPKGTFTPAQKEVFHMVSAHGGMIWVIIINDPPDDNHLIGQLAILHGPPNWHHYLRF